MIELIYDMDEMRLLSERIRAEGKSIGFVPTMGAVHEGHLSLIRHACKRTDFVIASIFVNPVQFGPNEDYRNYPRNVGNDAQELKTAGADMIFIPATEAIYPEGFATYVAVERLTDVLCGKSRPAHFRGVTTVVCKLFNIVKPDIAVFGQKDAQQLAVINRMVKDLNMDIGIDACPIVREHDGLAMSSRNSYLSDEERKQAPEIYTSLVMAQQLAGAGVTESAVIIGRVKKYLKDSKLVRIDYIEIVDPVEMEQVADIGESALLAIAAWIGSTRLIDNVVLKN